MFSRSARRYNQYPVKHLQWYLIFDRVLNMHQVLKKRRHQEHFQGILRDPSYASGHYIKTFK